MMGQGGAVEQQTQWQVAGSAPENYERYLVPAIFGPFATDLVELSAIQPGERVLDVACGPGVVARLAAEVVGATGRVVGVDLNAGMLAVARTLPLARGAPVEWREDDAAALQLPDGGFDVVLCQQGLQVFPDRPAALREKYGDRVGCHYSEAEDRGLFWSNDPRMPIGQMVRQTQTGEGGHEGCRLVTQAQPHDLQRRRFRGRVG